MTEGSKVLKLSIGGPGGPEVLLNCNISDVFLNTDQTHHATVK